MADGNYNDSLTNLVSGLGTGRDKASSAAYVMDLSSPVQLLTAYKVSSLARRVVDLKAEDSCREWREWQADPDQISAIEAEEKRLGLQVKMLRARKLARLFGGAALLIGTGDRDLAQPINTARIGRGGLKYVTVLTVLDVSGAGRQDDPTRDGFGQPEYWQLRGVAGQVHPSRLVRMHGQEPMYEFGLDQNYGFGDSVLLGGLKQVQDVDAVAANILSLVYEAKVDVFKIPDFMANLARRGPEYATEVIRRVTLAATAKGINGALLMDKEEEYEQKNASFGGLDALAIFFMQLCSAAHGYPMTLLFGMSAGGLNATGENDTRGYYDAVKVEQTLHMEPEMAVLDECLIRSALGVRPPEVHFNWRPLWQPTARERAENADKLASAGQKLRDMDAVSPEALSKAMVNALTETGAFPGLEAAAQEFPVDADDYSETAPVVPVVPEGLSDAAPRTLYVRRDVLNAAEIIAWAKAQGFKATLPADDMHVTIAFSKTPLDWMKVGQAWESKVEVPEGGPRLMERFGDARVLLFRASDLEWRHEAIKDAGASWDHPDYQPHITISYDPDSPDIAEVESYQGRIVLGPEIFEEVKDDWQAGVAEE